jgi:multidrug transporter EmrE-like cation transporter
MRLALASVIGGSVFLSSASQVVLKFGMSSPVVQSALTRFESARDVALVIATSPLVLAGLASFGLSAVLWLFVLSKVPLSSAYPFVALGIVLTVVAGRLLLNEPVPAMKLLGVALIVSGVCAVAAAS